MTERYKVRGNVLRTMGYDIAGDKLQADHWFQRVWDTGAETWFLPQVVTEKDKPPVVDLARTVTHGLGSGGRCGVRGSWQTAPCSPFIFAECGRS